MQVAPHIQNLKGYKPGKSIEETKRELGLTEIYKLASNECPLPPSERVVQAISAAARGANIYPDPSGHALISKMSQKWEVPNDWFVLGNGSNELIDLVIRTFTQPGENVVASSCAFIAYKICADAFGVTIKEAPMQEDLRIDVQQIKKAIDEKTRVVFLPNPNNPTGTYLTAEEVEQVLEHANQFECVVVLDEAYNEFVRVDDFPNSSELLQKYEKLMVMRTMSKVYGLAGLRIGVAIARPQIIDYIHRVRNPFNVNTLAQVAALEMLDDSEYLKKSMDLCWQGVDYFSEQLERMGFRYWPSQANFVLFDTGIDASEAFDKLLRRGVVLRPVVEYGLPTHLRMSIGDEQANRAAIAAIEEELKR